MTARDEIVAFKVGVKLKVDPRLTEEIGEKIDVSSDRGIVTLEGGVPSEDIARTAELVALSVAEVAGVENRLQVQAG